MIHRQNTPLRSLTPLLLGLLLACQSEDPEDTTAGSTDQNVSTSEVSTGEANTGEATTEGPTANPTGSESTDSESTDSESTDSGSTDSESTDSDSSDTTEATDTDTDTDTETTGSEDPYFHTCGGGGPTEQWELLEVDYPGGTFHDDQTEVLSGRYHIWAPAPGNTPLPLVIALHGDEGHPEFTKNHWDDMFPAGEFIFVAPQEPHQEVNAEADGWDNYPNQTSEFLFNILTDVGERYDVDIDRIYATGISAGSWVGGTIFFTFQETFAAVQLSCGGSTSVFYDEPSNPDCKTPVRFEISPTDFLYFAAEDAAAFLEDKGNEVIFHDTECEGHCCGGSQAYGVAAWDFFMPRSYCGTTSPGGCGSISM